MSANFDEKAIIQRFRSLRERYAGTRGKALFAKALGISSSTYNYYEKDRLPPVEVLWRACVLTGTDLNWLVSGQSATAAVRTTAGGGTAAVPQQLVDRIAATLGRDPKALGALEAFIDLLESKVGLESDGARQGSAAAPLARPRSHWLPVLGRTAAGVVHFWPNDEADLPACADLAQLIERHRRRRYRQVRPERISTDATLASLNGLRDETVSLVQLSEISDEGVCEFIDCAAIHARFPDAFALRVDGDSMAPRIDDGDLVVLSPSRPAGEGETAVVQLQGQIGVTCKIIRRGGDEVYLIAANETYDTRTCSAAEVVWALAVLWRIRIAS